MLFKIYLGDFYIFGEGLHNGALVDGGLLLGFFVSVENMCNVLQEGIP